MKDVDIEFEEPLDDESIDDFPSSRVSEAVVYSTDWTTETLLSQLQRENITIDPSFQRRDAWTLPRKSRYIESLILGIPVPQIVLAERKDQRGRYLVLDGKQRLLTLLQFTGGAVGRYNGFSLTSLEVRQDLNGTTFEQLSEDMSLRDDLTLLLNQTIRTVVIRNWPSIDFLHLVFVRLNTGNVPLSTQELRQALFPGPFVTYIDDEASKSPQVKQLLKIEEPDFRMRDVELLLRHIAFINFLSTYSGNLKKFLDDTCKKLNEDWDEAQAHVEEEVSQFEAAIEAGTQIFGDEGLGRRWTTQGYESRLNRAILDVVLFYLSDPSIRELALGRSEDVLLAYKNICTRNRQFRTAIESTTKSLTATHDRFVLWGRNLRNALGQNFHLPSRTNEGRIKFDGFWD